jgi:hypothetical protein
MQCLKCGRELDAQGKCQFCALPVTPPEPLSQIGDASLCANPQDSLSPWKGVVLTVLSIVLCLVILGLNYLRALHWAGILNAESFGYMIGGCLASIGLGFLAMFLVGRGRHKKLAPALKVFGIVSTAFVFSILAFVGEFSSAHSGKDADINHKVGVLLKEAAANQPHGQDSHWWDAPSRDFFHELIDRNQRYIAEVRALDNTAIQNLYSADSYAGKPHMEKVVEQLRAALDVEEKYASIDSLLKTMDDRVAAANASDREKSDYLQGFKSSIDRALAPRASMLQTEKSWMGTTIDLYDFMIANSARYSIRGGKLYFKVDGVKDEFLSRQSNAIALHKDFLKAKAGFDDNRKNNLDKLGISPTDLTPAQLGKLK